MSWFGSSGNKSSNDSGSLGGSSYSSYDSAPPSSFDYSPAPSASSSSRNDTSALEAELQKAQETVLVRTMLLKITDMAFEVCVPKPSSSLSSSEKSCVNNAVEKYLINTQFVMEKITKGH